MMKRLFFACLIAVISCVPAIAIEVPKDAQGILEKPATAYPSTSFNRLLTASGLGLGADAVANVPASYAKVSGDKVKFNYDNMVYKPSQYHDILTAYGLQISPEEVAARLGHTNYARVKNDKVVFGKTCTAYNRAEWLAILACYTSSAPVAAAPVYSGTGPGDSDGDGVMDNKDACPGTPKGIEVDARGCWTHAAELLFAFDSSAISKKYQPTLNDAKRVFDANPNMNVQIDGHTCDKGAEAYNQKLSVRRAQAVRDYLVNSAGINASRLSIKGYGETRPAYPNDSEANRAKNRRVEFTPMK